MLPISLRDGNLSPPFFGPRHATTVDGVLFMRSEVGIGRGKKTRWLTGEASHLAADTQGIHFPYRHFPAKNPAFRIKSQKPAKNLSAGSGRGSRAGTGRGSCAGCRAGTVHGCRLGCRIRVRIRNRNWLRLPRRNRPRFPRRSGRGCRAAPAAVRARQRGGHSWRPV